MLRIFLIWTKRKNFPPDLKPNQWFTYYATKFKTVEINSTHLVEIQQKHEILRRL
jgi:hypothetical protein